jgi:hypothetical protein
MFKAVMTLVFFLIIVGALKPFPSVKQIKEITEIKCGDICK